MRRTKCSSGLDVSVEQCLSDSSAKLQFRLVAIINIAGITIQMNDGSPLANIPETRSVLDRIVACE